MASLNRIGKYDVLETIGRGGMGTVFKAIDPMLGRLVAIKMMAGGFADDPDLLTRFYREAQSTASLTHPNIVTVYDMGDQDGMPYLVMQFLEGESLHAIIKSRRDLSLLTKTNYMLQVCHGLQYAHERQITHRDVKPANIMVLPDGTVKIVDFGIARIGNNRLTRPGQVMGSIHHMSPEQINEHEVDARSDIFALGTVAYEFLTYVLPFEGRDVSSTLMKILHDPAPPLSAHLKDYPAEFDAILKRALAKNKEERYQTADELALDLAQVERQLKKGMIDKLFQDAERLISGCDWVHAREQLQHLMKLDPQNASASQRMQQVQYEIQKQRKAEEVRQLRLQAEQLAAQQDCDPALQLLEQAIALAPEDLELKALRDSVDKERARCYIVRNSMGEALAARQSGDLEGALRSLERLLTVQPNDQNAARLKDEVALEIAERNKQRQLQLWIAEARRQISSRKFSDALETLKHVQELDGNAPRLRELWQLASDGAEQELHRRALEEATAKVSEALDRPDPSLARNLAEAALKKFPGERGLLRLKVLAEQQIEARDRHLWVGAQMTAARALLESGKSEDALAVLQTAWQKYPGEGDLESLMSIVRAAIQREQSERRRSEYMMMARDALRRKNYAEAIKTLETAKSEMQSNYFDDLLQFAKEEADHSEHEKKVEVAVAQAQQLIDSGDYEQAVQFLETALVELPDEDLRILAASARTQLSDYRHGLDELIATANQLAAQGRLADAITCLEAQRATYNREPRFQAAWAEVSQQQQRKEATGRAIAAIRTELEAGKVDTAERQLSAARCDLGDIDELRQLEEELRSLRASSIQNEIETVLTKTANLVRFGADAEALATLQSAGNLGDRVPLEIRARYDDLKSGIYQRMEEASTRPIGRESAPETGEWRRSEPEAGAPPSPTVRGITDPTRESRPSAAVLRAQQLQDKSVLELTPPRGIARPETSLPEVIRSDPASSSSGAGGSDRTTVTSLRAGASEDAVESQDYTLRKVEKQLASFVGSLARILVKKAASRASDLEELYAILAASLECEADREAFLARKAELSTELNKGWTRREIPRESLRVTSPVPKTCEVPVGLTTADIDRAARMLARRIGPIAGVLAKRAAQRAGNLDAFYVLLAEHVEDKTERSRFLRDVGARER